MKIVSAPDSNTITTSAISTITSPTQTDTAKITTSPGRIEIETSDCIRVIKLKTTSGIDDA